MAQEDTMKIFKVAGQIRPQKLLREQRAKAIKQRHIAKPNATKPNATKPNATKQQKIVSPILLPPQFAFIFYSYNVDGRPIGYPFPHLIVPAFQQIGARVQLLEFADYCAFNVFPIECGKPGKKTHEPCKYVNSEITTSDVVLEWDGVHGRVDWYNLFNKGKNYYIIPHNEYLEELQWKKVQIDNGIKVILGMDVYKKEWEKLFPNQISKMVLMRPPTRSGKILHKEECRQKLEIDTKYSIICWGYWSNKSYESAIPWLAEWGDTTLLFCGSGDNESKFRSIAENYKVLDKIKFSASRISDEDSDIWFSASDIAIYPYHTEHGWTATVVDVIGHSKACVTPMFPVFQELSTISGVYPSVDMKTTTRELLLDEKKRNECENKSSQYANENSFNEYARKLVDLIQPQITVSNKLRILLHSPLHLALWPYLMELLPEHKWFIKPHCDSRGNSKIFEEESIPINATYQIVENVCDNDYDVQIWCINTPYGSVNNIPVVLMQFNVVPLIPLIGDKVYPLISLNKTLYNKEYKNVRFTYVPPSKKSWDKQWIGDREKILIPLHYYTLPSDDHTVRDGIQGTLPRNACSSRILDKAIERLIQEKLPIDLPDNHLRSAPFDEWRDKFIHDRVLFELTSKSASFTVFEAMSIGMPVVVRKNYGESADREFANDHQNIITDGENGFLKQIHGGDLDVIVDILKKFLNDYEFAKRYGQKAKDRAGQVLSHENARNTFNQAFADAIKLGRPRK
jgi:glycosyltransferase involved in cell wall biosynthesis